MKMGLGVIARIYSAYTKIFWKTDAPTKFQKIQAGYVLAFLSAFVLIPLGFPVYDMVNNRIRTTRFNALSSTEHLTQAVIACGSSANACLDPKEATLHLSAIPPTAPEYANAATLGAEIAKQLEMRAQANFAGASRDSFKCKSSGDGQPTVSFDEGVSWWADDGRCGERREELRKRQREHLQAKRDAAARLRSYWPTTVRVDTDMDYSWLPDEERSCQTLPNREGRVATVSCNPNVSTSHNIPVRFWGGVDRNTVSSWKCRRQSDEFVCRAID